jgi:HSP20 family molecular chaperone IbpA
MIRKIKPVSRLVKITTEVDRIKRAPVIRREGYLGWDERWQPRFDVCEKPREVVVEVELPGVPQSDIVITVQSNRVEIQGTKKGTPPSENIRYLRLEREFGRFHRLVALPCAVVPDKAKAFLHNGVLAIFLVKYLPREYAEVEIEAPKKGE